MQTVQFFIGGVVFEALYMIFSRIFGSYQDLAEFNFQTSSYFVYMNSVSGIIVFVILCAIASFCCFALSSSIWNKVKTAILKEDYQIVEESAGENETINAENGTNAQNGSVVQNETNVQSRAVVQNETNVQSRAVVQNEANVQNGTVGTNGQNGSVPSSEK